MRLVAAVMAVLLAAAVHAQASSHVIEDWGDAPSGRLPARWSAYGKEAKITFTPAVVSDDGRRALHLKTERYSVRLMRKVDVDLKHFPTLTWEWKAATLPAEGDLRGEINDQAARLVLFFGPRWRPRAIAYVWDTRAPVGTELHTRQMVLDRWLVVVRSGAADAGKWVRETRNVERDFTRLFGAAPSGLLGVGIESHSEDAAHASEVFVGAISAGR
ncbi:MAG TPA: DUF3047 domain-containing protein [Methylomirabilota bacterium]|jgi:hypothetical protein|nr:DUF3047 domain-containing protein [Methylomirabilota bacterium]